ncbi:hypothetical protein [Hydrogenophaga sp. BPS33]|uniref:hypothetical protein n=1 Tax=Hydrogenophaga sp. BPS33 TaxID=2651974 RepID=UPI0013200777|nr:hypothetical protein [Hydrogenophaga sp. BPS33]QHE85334.1 hypothetical protein F9K07_10715 [Hydrogenophaga sp. BPS33]
MRHLILALMIALLPIRSWMGDAMAVAMLAAPTHGMVQAVADAPSPHAEHTQHEAMVGSQHTGMHDSATQSSGGEHTHKSCEVCNGPAMPFALGALPGPMPTPGLLAPPAERFASAEPQQGTKPPIS